MLIAFFAPLIPAAYSFLIGWGLGLDFLLEQLRVGRCCNCISVSLRDLEEEKPLLVAPGEKPPVSEGCELNNHVVEHLRAHGLSCRK